MLPAFYKSHQSSSWDWKATDEKEAYDYVTEQAVAHTSLLSALKLWEKKKFHSNNVSFFTNTETRMENKWLNTSRREGY